MISIPFWKYHGHGNDFVIVTSFDIDIVLLTTAIIKKICHRRYGIGADGLLYLTPHPKYSFEMIYYNSDGKKGSMCGNGGRCSVFMALKLGWISEKSFVDFFAHGNVYTAKVIDRNVSLGFPDIYKKNISTKENYFIDTGSPHHIEFVNDLDNYPVIEKGELIRYKYKPHGTNVNFVAITKENTLKIRTYERGVETETFACGTGAVACVLMAYSLKKIEKKCLYVIVKGGLLEVSFEVTPTTFSNIFLTGEVHPVFEGTINL